MQLQRPPPPVRAVTEVPQIRRQAAYRPRAAPPRPRGSGEINDVQPTFHVAGAPGRDPLDQVQEQNRSTRPTNRKARGHLRRWPPEVATWAPPHTRGRLTHGLASHMGPAHTPAGWKPARHTHELRPYGETQPGGGLATPPAFYISDVETHTCSGEQALGPRHVAK